MLSSIPPLDHRRIRQASTDRPTNDQIQFCVVLCCCCHDRIRVPLAFVVSNGIRENSASSASGFFGLGCVCVVVSPTSTTATLLEDTRHFNTSADRVVPSLFSFRSVPCSLRRWSPDPRCRKRRLEFRPTTTTTRPVRPSSLVLVSSSQR